MRERMRPVWAILAGIVLTIGLAACGTAAPGGGGDGGGDGDGDGPGGGDGPGETGSIGMVVVDQNDDFMGGVEYVLSAMFMEGTGFLPSDLEGAFDTFIGTCFVDSDEDLPDVPTDPTDPTDPGGGDSGLVFLSAGDEVTFEGAGGFSLALEKFVPPVDVGFPYVGYEMPDDADVDALPADLTVSAPGDEFPAFSGVAMPRASIPSSPAIGSEVDASTTFTWTPDSAGTYRTLAVNIEGTGAHEGTHVDCLLDDAAGSFSLATVSDLPGDYSGEVSFVSRDAFSFETVGSDARLMLLASGSQSFSFDLSSLLDRLPR